MGGREGGKEKGREGGREGGREEGSKVNTYTCIFTCMYMYMYIYGPKNNLCTCTYNIHMYLIVEVFDKVCPSISGCGFDLCWPHPSNCLHTASQSRET